MPRKWHGTRMDIGLAKYTGYFSVFNDHHDWLSLHYLCAKSAKKGLKTRLNRFAISALCKLDCILIFAYSQILS